MFLMLNMRRMKISSFLEYFCRILLNNFYFQAIEITSGKKKSKILVLVASLPKTY